MDSRSYVKRLCVLVGLCICGKNFEYYLKEKNVPKTTTDTNLCYVSPQHPNSILSLSYIIQLLRYCVQMVWRDFIPLFVQGFVSVLVHAGPSFNSSNRNFPGMLYPLRAIPVRDAPRRATNFCCCSHDRHRSPYLSKSAFL